MTALVSSVRWSQRDLTHRQMAMLMIIHLEPGPHTVRGLAKRLAVAKPAITRGLDKLCDLGYVQRRRDRRDMRNVFVEKCEAGEGFLLDFVAQLPVDSAATARPPLELRRTFADA